METARNQLCCAGRRAPASMTQASIGEMWRDWPAVSERGDKTLATGESPLDAARGGPEHVEGSNGAPGRTRTCGPRLRRCGRALWH